MLALAARTMRSSARPPTALPDRQAESGLIEASSACCARAAGS